MTPQQANELLECPFCRNELVRRAYNFHHPDNECWLSGAKVRPGEHAAWNRRAPAPTSEPGARDARPDAETLIKWINAGAFGMESANNRRIMCDHVRRLATPASPAVPAAPLAPSFRPANSTGRNYDPAPLVAQASPAVPNCRMEGGICACRSGGSFGGCAIERGYTTPFPEKPAPEGSPLVEDAQRIVAGKVEAVDPVVEANRELLHQRSQLGIKKYGGTLDAMRHSRRALMQHALEEALDLANYLQADIQAIDRERATTGNATADDGKDK